MVKDTRPCLENTDAIYSLSLFPFAVFSKLSYFVQLSFYFFFSSPITLSLSHSSFPFRYTKISTYNTKDKRTLKPRQFCETALKFRCWLKRFHFVRFSVYSTLYTCNNILYRAYPWAGMCVYVCACTVYMFCVRHQCVFARVFTFFSICFFCSH